MTKKGCLEVLRCGLLPVLAVEGPLAVGFGLIGMALFASAEGNPMHGAAAGICFWGLVNGLLLFGIGAHAVVTLE
jgi:hypothetical protein